MITLKGKVWKTKQKYTSYLYKIIVKSIATVWWFSRLVMSDSCDPMDCSPPGSSVQATLQARTLEWVAISFSRGASRPKHILKRGLQRMLEHCLNHMDGKEKVKKWPKGNAKGKEFSGKKINVCLWGEGGVEGWSFSSPLPLKNTSRSNHQHIFSIWKGGKIKGCERETVQV